MSSTDHSLVRTTYVNPLTMPFIKGWIMDSNREGFLLDTEHQGMCFLDPLCRHTPDVLLAAWQSLHSPDNSVIMIILAKF